MSYQKYKETIKATNEARRAAVRILINSHRQEFDTLYVLEATKRGLNPTKITAKQHRDAATRETEISFATAVDAKVQEVLSERGL